MTVVLALSRDSMVIAAFMDDGINWERTVDLLRKAQAGDGLALDAVIARYLPRMRRWASGRLPRGLRSMLDTGDLVQEAFIKALPHLDTLEVRDEGGLQFYLRRAIHNRIIDLYRRKERRPARDEMPDDLAGDEPSPLDVAIGAETREWYDRALATLSERSQTLIFLKLELGLSFKEIAEQMGQPSADAARVAVARAVKELAKAMESFR